jgi:hypothetical protein
MPMLLLPAPLSEVAYMSANSARADLGAVGVGVGDVVADDLRFLLEAFSPERPCWKLMGLPSGDCGVKEASVERLDGARSHRCRLAQLQVSVPPLWLTASTRSRISGVAPSTLAVPVGGGDAEAVAVGVARCVAGRPLEGVAPGAWPPAAPLPSTGRRR